MMIANCLSFRSFRLSAATRAADQTGLDRSYSDLLHESGSTVQEDVPSDTDKGEDYNASVSPASEQSTCDAYIQEEKLDDAECTRPLQIRHVISQ